METLYKRLLLICQDQGIEHPRNSDIQRLCGLTSGRVTQIKHAGSAARLGDESLRVLIRMGYLADWVQEGQGPKQAGLPPSPDAPPVLRLPAPTKREKWIAAIIEHLHATDEDWLPVVLDKAQEVARNHPLPAKKTGL